MAYTLPLAAPPLIRVLTRKTRTAVTLARQALAKPSAHAELLDRFESLGDNCEFASLQKRHGVDQPSFFRWRGLSISQLVTAVASELEGADRLDRLSLARGETIHDGTAEYYLVHSQYGYSHTFAMTGAIEPEILLQREYRRMVLLRRKFLDDLRNGRRTYVFRSLASVADQEVEALWSALRGKGARGLLWVRLAGPGEVAGRVWRSAGGVTIAIIDQLSGVGEGMEARSPLWFPILRQAEAISKRERARVGLRRAQPRLRVMEGALS
jgi:hypothetical protein